MTTVPSPSESVHQCFLQEAAELLQTMDTEIQDLQSDFSVQKVHNLMRAAHTLKGAAASVGLENIKVTTHSLEDVFKALCHQDTIITAEMDDLIFRAFECLQLLLSAQLDGAQIDENRLLDRVASVMSQLQALLGDRFGQEGYLPSSSDLGFDMTQSIFEVGVTQRIDELSAAIGQAQSQLLDASALFDLLSTQSDIFVGLAESLDLPGFQAIALNIQTALAAHPESILNIAQATCENLVAARAAVLAGDRTQGGQPSADLLAFCNPAAPSVQANQSVLPQPADLDFAVDFESDFELTDFALLDSESSQDIFGDELERNELKRDELKRDELEHDELERDAPHQPDDEIAFESLPLDSEIFDSERLPDTLAEVPLTAADCLDYTVDYPPAASDLLAQSPSKEPTAGISAKEFGQEFGQVFGIEQAFDIADAFLEEPLEAEIFTDVFANSAEDFLIEPPLPETDGLEELDCVEAVALDSDNLAQTDLEPVILDQSSLEKNSSEPGTLEQINAETEQVEPFFAVDLEIDKSEIEEGETVSFVPLTDDTLFTSTQSSNASLFDHQDLDDHQYTDVQSPDTQASHPLSIQRPSIELDQSPSFQSLQPEAIQSKASDASQVHPVQSSQVQASELQATSPQDQPKPSQGRQLPSNFVQAKSPQSQKTQSQKTQSKNAPSKNAQQKTIRIAINHLDQLGHSMGELLTQQNRQRLYTQQFNELTQQLLDYVQQHKALIEVDTERVAQSAAHAKRCALDRSMAQRTDQIVTAEKHTEEKQIAEKQFDSLELDDYSHTQLRSHQLLDLSTKQLETLEALEDLIQRSEQTADQQTRLLSTTRETLLAARMLPIGHVFQRFPNALRRLQAQHQKQAQLELKGEGVLVDKAIADKLFDPLLHLVRNAFDHGLESSEQRQHQGKAEIGTITLEAHHQGRYLVITVKDDGQGLNLEAIQQKAISSQLITAIEASNLTPVQTAELLFTPGFSTVSEVDDLSGRGVGLDAVQAQVRSLGGHVTIDHSLSQGTCFTLKIPASLTIARLLLCQSNTPSNSHTYAVMTDAVERIVLPSAQQIKLWEGGKALVWQSDEQEYLIPITSLHELLHYRSPLADRRHLAIAQAGATSVGQRPLQASPVLHTASLATSSTSSILEVNSSLGPVIVLRHNDQLVGIEIHQLLGEQELVINSLDDAVPSPDYLYGSSILPNGQLTLVLDSVVLAARLSAQRTQSNRPNNLQSQAYGSLDIRIENASVASGLQAGEKCELMPKASLILTVDDSATVRKTLTDTLQQSGYQVIQAKDGEEALQQIRAHPNIQLIVCDIEMPKMNGFEFLKARQQDIAISVIPTIMLSSRGGSKHRFLTQSLGASDHITKPYVSEELVDRVAELISRQAASVQASTPQTATQPTSIQPASTHTALPANSGSVTSSMSTGKIGT